MGKIYHGSSTPRLKVIEPRESNVLSGEKAVFGTTKRDVAISFLVPWTDDDFIHGEVNGQLYMQETKRGNFKKFFKGKSGYIYTLDDSDFKTDPKLTSYEMFSSNAQKVLGVEEIPDVLKALQKSEFLLLTANESPPWSLEAGNNMSNRKKATDFFIGYNTIFLREENV